MLLLLMHNGSVPLPCRVQQHRFFEPEALEFTSDPDLGISQAVSAYAVTDHLSFQKQLPHKPHASSHTNVTCSVSLGCGICA